MMIINDLPARLRAIQKLQQSAFCGISDALWWPLYDHASFDSEALLSVKITVF